MARGRPDWMWCMWQKWRCHVPLCTMRMERKMRTYNHRTHYLVRQWYMELWQNKWSILYALCTKCSNRLEILSGRKDHLAIGHDYWDILDAAVQHLTDERWTRHSESTVKKTYNMSVAIMKKACDTDDGIIETLNPDVIDIILQQLKLSMMQSAVRTIERFWIHNTDKCDDCHRRRSLKKLKQDLDQMG